MSVDQNVIVVIPAREASTRFPGKPLCRLKGLANEEKPLIQWTYETARRVAGVDAVYIATDSDEIASAANDFGANVVMTSTECRNGTERCAEALSRLEVRPQLVVNIQGDAPLTPPSAVSALIKHALDYPNSEVCTAALRCTISQLERLEADARNGIVGATTVAVSEEGRALYFSKQLIPYVPAGARQPEVPMLTHIGVYAYTPSSLDAYVRHPETALERLEGLEQLRFLDMGCRVDVITVDRPAWDIWELNNVSDVPIVEAGLAKMSRF
jgi:3-deoxy-manno-octulosonate cytidylyltransferase (CMP-KDO synthetase)